MRSRTLGLVLPLVSALGACADDEPGANEPAPLEPAYQDDGGIQHVKHVVILMQENHSFDNYFGALPYAPGSPYHAANRSGDGDGDRDDRRGCRPHDHACVDGLRCAFDATGAFDCANANLDDDGSTVHAFRNPNRCVEPNPEHGWAATHREANFDHPNATRLHAPMNGFVRVNDEAAQDNGGESPTEDETMGFYTQDEIPFYYDLASNFAISDRYFSSMLGPTFPNRCYLLAATSFGHLTTSDILPPLDLNPPGLGYRPITGTIMDLLDKNGVSWADYFQDAPQVGSFRPLDVAHLRPLLEFLAQAAGVFGACELPAVSFVDPNFGLVSIASRNSEEAPADIQRGQAFVSQVVNAVRHGPCWNDTVIFITWDENGGFYDHVPPSSAVQPDGINPGQCEDLSNPPASLQPGGGAECDYNLTGGPTSLEDAIELCPALAADPTGRYPHKCAHFDQYGVRVPFMAISPFSKSHYVSHRVADHTSILAFIENLFMPGQHLTRRDEQAYDLHDLFDFANSPSRDTPVGLALPPVDDCTPILPGSARVP